MHQGTNRWVTVIGSRWGKYRAGSLSPHSTSQHSDTCGVYLSLILRWCVCWWAVEHIQNVFGAVSYYVLKNNRSHAVALFLTPFLAFKATGGLKIPSFQLWLGLSGDQPSSRSLTRVTSMEQKTLPSPRKLHEFHELCVRKGGQRPKLEQEMTRVLSLRKLQRF